MATVTHLALVGNARGAAGSRAPASTDAPVLNPLQRDVASVYARLVDVAEHTTRFGFWLDEAAGRIERPLNQHGFQARAWVDYAYDETRGMPWLCRLVAEPMEPHLLVTGTKPAALAELQATAYAFQPAAANADPDRAAVDVLVAIDHLHDLLGRFTKTYDPPLLVERPGYGEPFGPHFLPRLVADLQGVEWVLGLTLGCLQNEFNPEPWNDGWDRLEARLGIAPEVAGHVG